MKKLYLSFANPETWRDNIKEEISKEEWRKIRLEIVKRDKYTCQYCGFESEKWQIVHHMDGNPNNNSNGNLETICPMCNLIHHAGQGCVVQGIVDLYRQSKYSQIEIIQITREMRANGKNDKEIVNFLELKDNVPFKMDKNYLRKLFGFVTSRATNGWTQKSLEFGYRKQKDENNKNSSLLSFQ
ncbi:MAG: HNH endonuclease [Candidatus Heimdallarchaeota archaeon]